MTPESRANEIAKELLELAISNAREQAKSVTPAICPACKQERK